VRSVASPSPDAASPDLSFVVEPAEPAPADSGPERAAGAPLGVTDVRAALRSGSLSARTLLRLDGTSLVLPAASFVAFGTTAEVRTLAAPSSRSLSRGLTPGLASAPARARDALLWMVAERGTVFGPVPGHRLRAEVAEGRHGAAVVAVLHGSAWFPIGLVWGDEPPSERPSELHKHGEAQPASPASPPGSAADAQPSAASLGGAPRRTPQSLARCPFCLESHAEGVERCPHCHEPPVHALAEVHGAPSSFDEPPGASWLTLHWRPLVTVTTIWAVLCAGFVLRSLAPSAVAPAPKAGGAAPKLEPECATACWAGESCELGVCVWQKPNDLTHVGAASADTPSVTGPFALAATTADVLPLDDGRFVTATASGAEIRSGATGALLTSVTDAPGARKLFRVGSAVYVATASRVHVLDVVSTQVLKTIDLGAAASRVEVGAGGRRALATLPGAHAVAVIATEYHAEIDRIGLGDDAVARLAFADSGRFAVAASGAEGDAAGALYVFDPTRLASQQGRRRSAMLGDPASVLALPDDSTVWVALRREDAIVPITISPAGVPQRGAPIATCREPEQLELVRRSRRVVVRCDEGKALEVLDVGRAGEASDASGQAPKLARQVAMPSRVVDLAISPDGRVALAALPDLDGGSLAVLDLDTLRLRTLPLGGEPSQVRFSSDGRTATVFSERAKTAWVVR
jgi:hypothetical protein